MPLRFRKEIQAVSWQAELVCQKIHLDTHDLSGQFPLAFFMEINMKRVDVAVGVILRDTHVFISKRADTLHQGGKWEFPGGKREDNETFEEALARELREETAIEVKASSKFTQVTFDYPDKMVTLDVYLVESFDGEPEQLEGQIAQWVAIEDLDNYDFPTANKQIVSLLKQRFVEK